ncbi:PREDICTED: uncharacterized protein LOC108567568 [Nicrophorus vespilloides]|uniref:Uncharacterized protein LOC108567568 n=1 Tax=Nicrophorus vespilloides TaxID=110193 RepID=A0ABM1N9V1_NICVS|nr:PREDICTED: uncharacterized protein LOC108567568 [Nicrophorus vespilloides]
MMKTHASVYTNVNGHKETHSNSRSEVKEDGQLLAGLGQRIDGISNGRMEGTIRTNLDIPSKGLHKSLIEQLVPTEYTENGNRRSVFDGPQESNNNNNQFEKIGAYAGTQYSPLDMAEYVFWTGDEKGVTMAIEEFLQEGILSREEAISFLQEIKYNLDYLQSHYTQLGLNARDRLKEKSKSSQEPKNHLVTGFRQQQNKKSAVEDIYRKEVPEEPKIGSVAAAVQKQEATDYDELLERLKVADFLYTEYSLEEVIYQLAKVMFTQSLTRGSAEAQQALQKFTAFLETEADQGHISRALEKKVLDVLIASLSDTLNEHPELAANNGEVNSYGHDGQTILRQILQMNAGEKTGVVPASYKDQISRNPLEFHLQDKPHLPIGLGKYKTIR